MNRILDIAVFISTNNLDKALELFEEVLETVYKDSKCSSSSLAYLLLELNFSIKAFLEYENMVSFESLSMKNFNLIFSQHLEKYSDKVGKEIITSYFNALKETREKTCCPILDNVLAYIRENYNNGITLEELCAEFNVSRSYISSLFKNKLGKSFKDILNDIRCKCAEKLLKATDYSIEYISYLCGFESQSYFSVVFKKYKGISPRDYRKKAPKVRCHNDKGIFSNNIENINET